MRQTDALGKNNMSPNPKGGDIIHTTLILYFPEAADTNREFCIGFIYASLTFTAL